MDEIRFGELYEIPSSNGLSRPSAVRGEGYKMVNMGELFANNIILDMEMERVKMSEKELQKFLLKDGDLLFARQSLVASGAGKCSIVKALSEETTFESHLIRVRLNNRVANPWYYYYLFQLPYNPVKTIVNQCAQAGIRGSELVNIKVPLLDLQKQTKIASILSAYDDLIENNNKRIKILEQMGENLYKEWFVRFRFPGHETAEFENGIPKGWEILRMENFCYVTDGTHDTPKETNLGVPLVTGRCIRNGFVDYDEAYLISEDDHNRIKKRSGLKSGDILFSNIGTVGNTCLVDYEREFSVKNVIIFKPPIRAISAYLYYWLISPSMQAIFSTQTNGASQQFVGLTFMRRIKILVPNKYIMTSFEKNVAPIIDAMMMLHKENQNLIKQRDLLLPRLMSGKLEVEM